MAVSPPHSIRSRSTRTSSSRPAPRRPPRPQGAPAARAAPAAPTAEAAPSGAPAAGDDPAVADFYRGKTVRILVGFAPGGGYDTYSRVIGRHLRKYIPGNPTVIV